MKNWVNEWVQEGNLCVWRYADPSHHWRGWHFAADPKGSRSVRNLLDRMHAGEQCHRTLKLAPVTDAILSGPNYRQKKADQFEKLRIDYLPSFEDLRISPDGDVLIMTIGDPRLRKLAAAFARVEVGGGDFDIETSNDRKADPWMFWWMPKINYHDGKRQ